MKATSWSFTVISAHNPVIEKMGMSFKAALILVAAFVVAFLMTVLLLLMFPSMRVNESGRIRLAAENQTLRIESLWRPGFDRSQDRPTSTTAASGSRCSSHTRTRICMGRRLLVSGGKPLEVA